MEEKKIMKLQEWTTKDLHMRKEVKLKKGTQVEHLSCVIHSNLGHGVVVRYTRSQYEIFFPKDGKVRKFFGFSLSKVSDGSCGPDWKMKKPLCQCGQCEQDVLEVVISESR